jgi:hypothetical protein
VQTDDDGDGTYGAAWSLSDYQLWPRRTASAPEQRPYREIRAVGAFRFPYVASIGTSVKVTGRWGWPEVPTPVRQACLIQASRLYKRSQSPEGVTGFGSEFGAIRLSARPDPDVVALLAPYRLTAVLVA